MNMLLERRRSALNAKKIPWDNILIQTLDMTKDGYNPAVAIVLNSKNFGTLLSKPITSGGGRYYITKTDAALITSNMSFNNRNDVVDTNGIVSDDTTATYPFESFEEFQYFTGITSTIQWMFSECTKLKSIIFPSSITTYAPKQFNNNSALENVTLLSSTEVPISTLQYSSSFGTGTGVVDIRGDVHFNTTLKIAAKKILIKGNIRKTGNNTNFVGFLVNNGSPEEFRLKGSITQWPGWSLFGGSNRGIFYEYMSDVTNINMQYAGRGNAIIHLGYNGIGMRKVSAFWNNSTIPSKVYVGDGSSQSSDQAVLNQYLADTDWATQSAKLDLWWNYNGQYRTYTVTNNLTNFTNSNPVEWPYITRNESYNTTIISNNGTPLSRIIVKMYQAVDNGVTPDNPTDITSQVYNANTGEINIPHVTGNVIIEQFNEIKLHPTSLDSSRSLYHGYGWPANEYSLVYKYADDYSMGDWRVNNASGSNGYVTFFIDCSSIPENATILSVECAYRAKIDGGCSSTTKLVCGNTVKSEESQTSTTGSIVTMNNAGTWTRSELDSCAIMFSINPNNLQHIKYMWLSGATLTVKYK